MKDGNTQTHLSNISKINRTSLPSSFIRQPLKSSTLPTSFNTVTVETAIPLPYGAADNIPGRQFTPTDIPLKVNQMTARNVNKLIKTTMHESIYS